MVRGAHGGPLVGIVVEPAWRIHEEIRRCWIFRDFYEISRGFLVILGGWMVFMWFCDRFSWSDWAFNHHDTEMSYGDHDNGLQQGPTKPRKTRKTSWRNQWPWVEMESAAQWRRFHMASKMGLFGCIHQDTASEPPSTCSELRPYHPRVEIWKRLKRRKKLSDLLKHLQDIPIPARKSSYVWLKWWDLAILENFCIGQMNLS